LKTIEEKNVPMSPRGTPKTISVKPYHTTTPPTHTHTHLPALVGLPNGLARPEGRGT